VHAGNRMKHMKAHHPQTHKSLLEEADRQSGPAAKVPKLVSSTLNGVKMSAPALQLHCVRLVSENGLAFKMLDYPAFQDIIQPMLNAMPAAER